MKHRKKRIKTDSDSAKTSAKTSMELDQQLTELKNKYLTVNFEDDIEKRIFLFLFFFIENCWTIIKFRSFKTYC
jgi:hypothetical protein